MRLQGGEKRVHASRWRSVTRGQPPASFSYRRLVRKDGWLDDSTPWSWKATQEPPWRKRARNRKANRVARRSRKAHR